VVLAAASLAVSAATGGTASAATAPAVPIAGVYAFGIGVGQVGSPSGVAVDAAGDVFVADTTDSRVMEFRNANGTLAQTGVIVAGAGGAGSGLSQLSSAGGVALDANRNLFVSDPGNARVIEYAYNSATGYATSGVVVAGSGGRGSALNQLNSPAGIALDSGGDLFVADSVNNRVLEFPLVSGSYAANGILVGGSGGYGGGANQLSAPNSVAVTARGDLIVADHFNARVVDYPVDTTTGTYPVNGSLLSSLPSLAGWVTLDPSGNLFVSYGYLGYGGVLKFAFSSATGFATSGTAIGGNAMIGPAGLTSDSAGNLFVAETSQTSNPNNTVWNLVLKFTYDSTTGSYTPPGTVMNQQGRVNQGVGSVALDSEGNLYASDGSVFEYALNRGANAYSVIGTPITSTTGALAFDSGGNLFVGSSSGVLKFPKNASGGYPVTGVPVPGATQLATLAVGPIAFDSNDDLFVSTPTQVLEFPYSTASATYAATGTVVATVTTGGSNLVQGVQGIALDASGDLFVSDAGTNRVQEYLYDASSGRYAATGVTVAGGVGGTALLEPTQLAVNRTSSDLLVYDGGNARILQYVFDPVAHTYTTSPSVVFSGGIDNYPEAGGIALDANGDVFFGFNFTAATVYEATAVSSPSPVLPAVTGVTPTTGPAAGGTVVTVSGSNLAGGRVSFGAVAATGVTCTASSCTATSPAGTGTLNVSVTTSAGTSASVVADQFTYQPAPPPSNLVPNPGFEVAGVPADHWGGGLVRTSTVVHSGSWGLAETTTSTSGGWDVDSNSSWYAPVSPGTTYTATIWVRSSAAVRVSLNVDLLNSKGSYLDSATGPNVSLTPNTWTKVTLTGIKPTAGEVFAGMEPNFSRATRGTVIVWDDLGLTTP
jgi:sugar lactone lactonase YvrE